MHFTSRKVDGTAICTLIMEPPTYATLAYIRSCSMNVKRHPVLIDLHIEPLMITECMGARN